ncbi:MAG: sterol desaturase/sphingolipid hydroxylase (fatty acid hydroxylase superfamily) [Bermanella sp.]|jgi:sterol desaturase/sphingolipid hydroxylase (fatty acid hydroxylase superfamily)
MQDSALSITSIGLIAFAAILTYSFAELVWLSFARRQASFRQEFYQPLKNLLFVLLSGALLAKFFPVIAVAAIAIVGQHWSVFQLPDVWYSWIAALLIYEFWYWLQHYLAHKVRVFWCIHSPHHAPDSINMLVGTNHHVLEGLLYFPLFLGLMPALCGVPVEMIVVINLLDGLWGSFLHLSPKMVKGGRYGMLEFCMQTPSHHRVHHAKNIRYMDKNFNSITVFWDWVMGTRQRLDVSDPVNYGITRKVNVESFRDVQFGEFAALWGDIAAAPGLRNKISYLFMPPGWSHLGDHKTVFLQQRAWREAKRVGS